MIYLLSFMMAMSLTCGLQIHVKTNLESCQRRSLAHCVIHLSVIQAKYGRLSNMTQINNQHNVY